MRIGKKRGRGVYMEKEALEILKYLLKNDKDALLRVMSEIKNEILEEESKAITDRLIVRAKDKGWESGL